MIIEPEFGEAFEYIDVDTSRHGLGAGRANTVQVCAIFPGRLDHELHVAVLVRPSKVTVVAVVKHPRATFFVVSGTYYS